MRYWIDLTEGLTNFGRGWWFNLRNGRVVEIMHSDLGPHGDHDGWISLGDNAESIGVDPQKAKLFQAATYGFMVSPDDPRIADIDGADDLDLIDGQLFVNPLNPSTDDGVERAIFVAVFGVEPEAHLNPDFEELVRLRYWTKGFFSVLVIATINRAIFAAIQRVVLNLVQTEALKVETVSIESDGIMRRYSMDEFATMRFTDFMRKGTPV